MSFLESTARKITGTDDYGKKFLWIPKLYLQLMCMWPEQANNFKMKFISILTLCSFAFYGFGFGYKFTEIPSESFEEMFQQAYYLSGVFHALTKMSFLYFFKNELKSILYDIQHKFLPYDLVGEKLAVEIKSIYQGVTCLMMLHITSGTIYLTNLFIHSWIARRYPYLISYPTGFEDNPVVFSILFIGEIYLIPIQMGTMIIGCDHLFVSITSSIIVQYKILHNLFFTFNTPKMSAVNAKMRLISNDRFEEIYRDENKEFFVRCVRHHQLLLEMIKKMNNIFGWIAIPQVVCIICILCGIIFKLNNEDSSSYSLKLEALLMTINMFSELGLYCVAGNELHYQASLLPEYIFQTNWHNLNSNEFKKDLMFVLQRSQDIPYLNAYGLYNFDLNFFIMVVKMSFSIYTFFTQIKK